MSDQANNDDIFALSKAKKHFGLVYLAVIVGLFIWYASTLNGIVESSGVDRLGRDFLNFWTGGRQVWRGDVPLLYDREAYTYLVRELFGTSLNDYYFSYPPHAMILLSPFGALPYVAAWAVWSVGGVAALYFAASRFLKTQAQRLVLVLSPAVLICLISGQTGLYTAALFIGGFGALGTSPVLAGVCFGLLTVKPQLGLLLAVALLAMRQWTAIATTIIVAAVLGGLSIVFWGLDPWQTYITETIPFQREVIAKPYGIFDHMVHTPFKWVINVSGNEMVANILQGAFSLATIVVTYFAFRKNVSLRLRFALLCTLTFLASPYIAIYDMPLLAFGCILYLTATETLAEKRKLEILALVLSLPILGVFASVLMIPLSVLAITWLAYLIFAEINQRHTNG